MKKQVQRNKKPKNRDKKYSSSMSATQKVAELQKQLNALKLTAVQMLKNSEAKYMFLHKRSKAWKDLAKKYKDQNE